MISILPFGWYFRGLVRSIDYLANDAFHLNAMGENIELLKENMVDLRGKTLKEKYHLYITDMEKILSECARVLKPARF
ncbi:MAG: hypothetical protein KKF30_09995 [Proteobacteria bacterium]|nr:hypothetical protein [Pseudomonadota bacterium]MBU4468872.1 hypothetical protein [Pseudomonadota bacterium]